VKEEIARLGVSQSIARQSGVGPRECLWNQLRDFELELIRPQYASENASFWHNMQMMADSTTGATSVAWSSLISVGVERFAAPVCGPKVSR
jgi:hypothetical protein